MGHSSVERRLRSDIDERHILKNELSKRQSLAEKLTGKLERTKKKRLNNRYSATIERLDTEIEDLKQELYELNLDLQKRIADEMEFSEDEIRGFREQYKRELAEVQETEDKLRAIQEGESEPEVQETPEEEPPPKEAIVARTRRMLDREKKIAEEIQREITSEERDRIFFTKELQQITAELRDYEAD